MQRRVEGFGARATQLIRGGAAHERRRSSQVNKGNNTQGWPQQTKGWKLGTSGERTKRGVLSEGALKQKMNVSAKKKKVKKKGSEAGRNKERKATRTLFSEGD